MSKLKQVPNFNGYYADTDGNIYSCYNLGNHKIEDKIHRKLKQGLSGGGYHILRLRRNDRLITQIVHRLVLETFIGPCPEGMQCCHSDGNLSNNRLSNLRWDTSKNNAQDKIKHGSHDYGEKHVNSKLNNLQIRIIFKLKDSLNKKLVTQTAIAKYFGVSVSLINMILRGKRWKRTVNNIV